MNDENCRDFFFTFIEWLEKGSVKNKKNITKFRDSWVWDAPRISEN